ncbi:hypothetical protein [Sporohalobacter salinus]|uniref:hypothetical protein n=1 Tax=Sporohalobacter salinus TaxID=1494606 RepID=UPI00195FE8E6|nr:hypothetical protein [Sporohalobacter salinus]MBM7624239.1 hypothetical protein [Sporohalobacter salinus]
MFKKVLGIILFVVATLFVLASFLVAFIPLSNGSGISLGILKLSGQLIGTAIFSLLMGIKLVNSEKWKKIVGIIMIIFGGLFGINLIMSMFYITDRHQGMSLAFGMISFLCVCLELWHIKVINSFS